MPTRNIVPRANGEGGIGTSAKHWGNGFFDNLSLAGEDVAGTLSNMDLALAESTGYGIVSGCEPSISGLTVTVGAGIVHLAGGTRKEIAQTNITLDAADGTNPRIDLVYIDSTGTVAKVTGTAAASPSAPALPTGGISVCNVTVAAGATTGTINHVQTIAPNLSNYGVVNVKDFGAVGDGATDDTQAIKAAIAHGGSIYLPRGTYLISDTLEINLERANICGAGSKTIIKAAASFPANGFLLFFYTTSLDFLSRNQFINKNGNLSLVGLDGAWIEECRSYDFKVSGIKLSGEPGTDYEGQLTCQLFENITFDYLYTCLELGSHVYKNLFQNLVFNWARYSVTSATTTTDSGEANTFVNCAFWQRIKISKQAMYCYGCTIHFKSWAWENEPYGHYFGNGDYRFINCHFEWLNEADLVFSRLIYAIGSNVTISDSEFIFNTPGKYRNYFFFAENNAYIVIKNCNSFVAKLVSTDDSPVCNPCVYIKGLVYWYDLNLQCAVDIHEKWKYFLPAQDHFATLLPVQFCADVNTTNTTITRNSDNSVSIHLVRNGHTTANTGVYRRVPVGEHKSMRLVLQMTGTTTNVQYQLAAVNVIVDNHQNATFLYGLVFADSNGCPVPVRLPTIIYAAKKVNNAGETFNYDYTLPIPPNAEYIYYGVGINDALHDAIDFTVNKCYVELM